MADQREVLDLRRYGYDVAVPIEGTIVEQYGKEPSPLILLFDEDHNFFDGIRQSLCTACALIDLGVVDIVGVEGYSGDARDWFPKRCGISAADLRAQLDATGSTDSDIIAWGVRCGFAQVLAVLRPETLIVGLEDPTAYQEAIERKRESERPESTRRETDRLIEEAIAEVAEEPGSGGGGTDLGSWMELLKRRIAEKACSQVTDFARNQLDGPRSSHFVSNLRLYRKKHGCGKATIINAGAAHHDTLSGILRQEQGWSLVRIRPAGFPTLPGPARPPREMTG